MPKCHIAVGWLNSFKPVKKICRLFLMVVFLMFIFETRNPQFPGFFILFIVTFFNKNTYKIMQTNYKPN